MSTFKAGQYALDPQNRRVYVEAVWTGERTARIRIAGPYARRQELPFSALRPYEGPSIDFADHCAGITREDP